MWHSRTACRLDLLENFPDEGLNLGGTKKSWLNATSIAKEATRTSGVVLRMKPRLLRQKPEDNTELELEIPASEDGAASVT